jgi:hypothetical protein
MHVLLVHPEDSPSRGPWSKRHWDLIVDLGKSSQSTQEEWARKCGSPVLRLDSFRNGVADAKQVRQIFSSVRGRLVDEEGIDWWDLLSLLIAPEALSVLALERIALELPLAAEYWVSRRGVATRILEILLNRQFQSFGGNPLQRLSSRAKHYGKVFRRFSPVQIKEIVLDKYDSGYRWRSRFAPNFDRCGQPVVLLPSAYENVSRMAYAYARLLPEQRFLMVATRASAKKCAAPGNVQIRDLAAYATTNSSTVEAQSLIERWRKLQADLQKRPQLRVLIGAQVMDPFPAWIRDGLSARDAWRQVLDRDPGEGLLCGDDSNLYTRLPVLLAANRNIPTADFHHGALDGRYLLKELASDLYFAKNDMERDYLVRVCELPEERVVICAPPLGGKTRLPGDPGDGGCAIFFSEPYEVGGMRPQEVYREIFPPLCRLAREHGRRVILKLHPFEGLSQRKRIIGDVLAREDHEMISVVDGPLTPELLGKAWFGMTVDSTSVIDCLQAGVCCFLCKWLSLSPYGYMQQYVRYGIGEGLENVREIGEIPQRLGRLGGGPMAGFDLSPTIDSATLQRWLTTRELSSVRSVS